MGSLASLIAVALGGALGAVARFATSAVFNGWVSTQGSQFPLGTLVVNVLGSFLFGLLIMLFLKWGPQGEPFKLFLLTGFLGAYTTFSTFSFETIMLIESNLWITALTNVFSNVFGALLAFWLAHRVSTYLFS